MIDFTDLEARDCDAIARVAHTDSKGVHRGACNQCDCHEWVDWLHGIELPAARPYNLQRHDLANAGPFDACRRCGCSASWHEDISEMVGNLSSLGVLVDAEEGWTDEERWLFYRTGGGFFPGGLMDRWDQEGACLEEGQRGPLVSVICPTESDRRDFHPCMYNCFIEQTHEPKELVVVDTGEGRWPSEFFTRGPPASDQRVVYRYFDAFETPWSIGVKRNVACRLARGSVIVHFDDDDLYAPTYVACMVRALQEGGDCFSPELSARVVRSEGESMPAPEQQSPAERPSSAAEPEGGDSLPPCFRHPGFAAGAATFSAWFTYTAMTGTFGLCDVDCACGGRRDWAFGYGFSFAYLRDLWQAHWFPDANMGEDHMFFEALLARGVTIALLRDEGAGICAHVRHKSNFSPGEQSSEVDQSSVGKALPVLGERLRAAIATMDRAVQSLGATVRLTPKTAEAMQDALLVGFANEEFQKRLHETFLAAEGDPQRQRLDCRHLCLEVQGPIISRYGFEASFMGVLASTAAFKLVMAEEWENPETVSFQKGALVTWLMRPDYQYAAPKDWEEVLRTIDLFKKKAAARRKRD